jgi:hypothetical protein
MKSLLIIQVAMFFGMFVLCNNALAQAARGPITVDKPTSEDMYYRGTSAFLLRSIRWQFYILNV